MQTWGKTGWGIGYDGGQGARQKTRLTARCREEQVEIKPNGMGQGERERGGGRAEEVRWQGVAATERKVGLKACGGKEVKTR